MANSVRINRLKQIFRRSFHCERQEAKKSVAQRAETLGLTDLMNTIVTNRFGCKALDELSLSELDELDGTLLTLHNLKSANQASNVVAFRNRRST